MVSKKYKVIFFILTFVCLFISMGVISATDSLSDNDNSMQMTTSQQNDLSTDNAYNVETNTKSDVKTKNISNDSTNNLTSNLKTLKTANYEKTVNNYDELKSVLESKSNIAGDTIKITLNVGTYTVTTPITISKRLIITIDGNGQTIDGNNNQFIKLEKSKSGLNITNITISNCKSTSDGSVIYSNTNSNITLSDSKFTNNGGSNGGVIYSKGNVTVINSLFENNTAVWSGAAIWHASENSRNIVKVINSTFSGNNASDNGGAIYTQNDIFINESKFINNYAKANGGAVITLNNTSTVADSLFVNNTAGVYGGAIYSKSNITIKNSNFTNNKVHGYGIDYLLDDYGNFAYDENYERIVYDPTNPEHADVKTEAEYYGDGGAIFTDANLISDNNLYKNNSAISNGGAIYSKGGNKIVLAINNNTFVNNNVTKEGGAIYTSTDLSVNNSIFINNSAKSNASDIDKSSHWTRGGSISSHGNGIISNSYFTNSSAYYGGAINSWNYHVTSLNNTFINNSASNLGGAIYSILLIANDTLFENNTARVSGGAVASVSELVGNNVSFINNHAIGDGGALILTFDKSNLTLSDSSFINNTGYNGGAIRAGRSQNLTEYDVNLKFSNVTFDKNNGYRGSAIYLINTNASMDSLNITNNVANLSSTVAVYYTNLDINDTTFVNNTATSIGLTMAEYSNITINNSKIINNTGNESSVLNSMNTRIEIDNSELINNSGLYGVIVSHVTEHYYYGYTRINGSNLTGNVITIELDEESLNWHYDVVRSDKSSYSENYIEITNNVFRNNTNFKHGMLFGDFADYYVTNNTYISNYLEVFYRDLRQSFDKNGNYVANATLQIREVCNSSVDNSKLNVYVDGVLYKQFDVNNNQSTIVIDKNTMNNMKSNSIRLEFVSPRLDYHGFNWTVELPQRTHISITANDTVVGQHLPITGKLQSDDGRAISSVNATLIINSTEIPIQLDKYGSFEYTDYIPHVAGPLNISVRYDGDDKYYPSENSTSVTITSSNTVLNAKTINDVVYNDTVTVSGTLSSVDGPIGNTKINITINGDVKEVNVDKNGNFKYEFNSTKLGNNRVLIFYPGNDKYDEARKLLTFNTTPLDTILTFEVTNYTSKNDDEDEYTFKYSQMLKLNGTLKDKNGNPIPNVQLDVYVNGYEHKDTYSIETNLKGEFNYTRRIRYMEDKNLSVSFKGDQLYKASSDWTNIKVIKMGTKLKLLPIPYIQANTSCYVVLTLDDEEGKPIENHDTYLHLTPSYIDVRINGTDPEYAEDKNRTVFAEELTKFRFAGSTENLPEGNYTIRAVFEEGIAQKYYISSNDSFTLQAVYGLSIIEIDEIPKKNRTLGDSLTVSGTLRDRNGNIIKNTNVSIYFNGHNNDNIPVDENGRFSFTTTIIEANTEHIRVSYAGNETYTPGSNTTTVEIDKAKTTLELYTDRKEELYGDKLLIYGWLKGWDGTGRKDIDIGLKINIFTIGLETDENGYFEYWTTTRFVGVNNVTVHVNESEDYQSANNNTTFIMKKRNTTITLDVPEEMTIGEETIINGTLSGLYGRINYNQVTVYINNGKYYLYTDDDGEFFLPYKATSMGIKNVTAIYYGDEQRTNSTNSKQINVVKKKTNITLSIDKNNPEVNDFIEISGKLTDANGQKVKNAYVDLIINGQKHTLRVESTNEFHYTHHATIRGLNNVTVKFNGNNAYEPCSKNVRFSFNKKDAVIIMTQSQKDVELNDKLTITGILLDNEGHAIENAKLLLTINNNNVTITTVSEGYFNYSAVQKKLGKFAGKLSYVEDGNYNSASEEFTYNVVEKLPDQNIAKTSNNQKIAKNSASKSYKIATEYHEHDIEVILENHNTTGYNHTEEFPHNTTVTIHEVVKHLINTNVSVISSGIPIYYEDGYMAYCIDKNRAAPIDTVIYDREMYGDTTSNQTRDNAYTSEDVVKYLKTFIITHLGDTQNFTEDIQKQNVIYGFTDFSYRDQSDSWYDKSIIDADGNSHPISEFVNETIELVEAGHVPANNGTVVVDNTLYNYYFAYSHPNKYVADQDYQRTFGIYLYPLPFEFAWGFVLKNESTVENITESFVENITELEEYDETVEYNDTEEIIVPYNETVNVTVEHTREVPYNETVNVTRNITVTVPYIVEEEYVVNVTKTVPYTEVEEYVENVTKTVPYTDVEEYTVYVNKTVPYTDVEEYTVYVNKTVPYTDVEEYTVYVNKTVPYTDVEEYIENVTKKVPYTEVEEYTENVTRVINYTVEEPYIVNRTIVEPYNETEKIVKNRTISVPEVRYRNVTKYIVIGEPVIKYRNVTKYKTVVEPVVMYRNVTKNRTVIVPETRYRNVTKTRTVVEPVTKYRNVTKYRTVVEPVTKYRNVTKTRTISVPEVRYRNVTKTRTVVEPEIGYRNVTKYRSISVPEVRYRNVTKTRTVVEPVTKYRNVTKTRTVIEPETRYRNVTKYRNETSTITEPVTITKYKNETYTEIEQKTVTKNRTQTITVPKTKTYHYSRPVTHSVTTYKTYSYDNFKYKLYIYILYLNGNITFEDLVAILGEENIHFDENGQIVLEYDDTDYIPNYIQVRADDGYTGEENIPATGEDVHTDNPVGFDEPVMDAGITDVVD